MSPKEKKQSIVSGHTIAMKHLMGSENDDRRARMKAAGCVFDNPAKAWVCPNQEAYAQFMSELGLTPSKPMPKPVAVAVPAALPAIVAPPPGAKTELKLVAAEPVAAENPVKPEIKQVEPERMAIVSSSGKRVLELPPSFIVTQQVSHQGDIRYLTLDEQNSSTEEEDGTKVDKKRRLSETITRDPEEYKASTKLASQLRTAVRKLGSVIQSGVILVPCSKEKELDEAISDTRRQAIDFNRTAQHHYVRVSILKSLITTDAEAAARDVAQKLQETVEELKAALESCDTARIKSAIDNNKPLARILPAKEANALTAMLASAEATKKYITEQVEKKKTQIEVVRKEVARTAMGPIDNARMAFLELAVPVEMEVRSGVSEERFAELEESQSSTVAVAAANGDRFDM